MRVMMLSRAVLTAILAVSTRAGAQSTLDAPTNVASAWMPTVGVVQFNLLHRFSVGSAPTRKITNSPTFTFATGITSRLGVGATYASNSEVIGNYPNEWEFFGRLALLAGDSVPVEAFVQGGYNNAAESADGSVTLARRVGPIRLLATGGVLSSAFYRHETRAVFGGGASLKLRDHLAVSGDAHSLGDRHAGEKVSWSGALQVGIPYTPHTLSLHVTNVNSRTLEGVARGTGTTRYGFEYTIPITVRRYVTRTDATPKGDAMKDDLKQALMVHDTATRVTSRDTATMDVLLISEFVSGAPGDTIYVDIKQMAFATPRLTVKAGTTVIWYNRDPLEHQVVEDHGTFTSTLIPPNRSWAHTFTEAGTFTFHCAPHPFMKGTITVTSSRPS